MFSISVAWIVLKKMPRISMLLLLLINVFILAFLLLGCYSDSSTYSSTYLVKYSFNESSAIYPLITSSYKSRNLTDYEMMQVRAGYLSLCIDVGEDRTCMSKSNLGQFIQVTAVDIYTVNSNSSSTSLDIVSLASEFSNEIVHPYILIACIVLTIVLFLSLLYVAIPGLPAQILVNKFNLALAPILALVWGLGAMWAHVAANASQRLVEKASMGIVVAHIGKKASAMTWTPFTFAAIVAIGAVALHVRDLNRIIRAVDEKV